MKDLSLARCRGLVDPFVPKLGPFWLGIIENDLGSCTELRAQILRALRNLEGAILRVPPTPADLDLNGRFGILEPTLPTSDLPGVPLRLPSLLCSPTGSDSVCSLARGGLCSNSVNTHKPSDITATIA